MVVLVIGCIEGWYETQEVPFGEVYSWRSGCVILECDCGEVLNLTNSATACSCGMNHEGVVREELAGLRLGDEALHPWRYVGDREDAGILYWVVCQA